MGWHGGKFPVLAHLNVLTNPSRIRDTQMFFMTKYGVDGTNYQLGDLCFDWDSAQTPPPPWNEDEDNPYDLQNARDWQRHCRHDLNDPNTGVGAVGTVREDLTNWIRSAILNGDHIKYKYKRIPGNRWKADLQPTPTHVRITVYGPGF